MVGDKSPSLDEDKFQQENMQQSCFSFEGDNSQSSTIQYFNNILDNVCVTPTIQENILKNSNSSNSLISQEHNCATNSQKLAPSQYILSFENSSVKPSPNSVTCSSIMVQKTTLNNNIVSELPKTIKKRTKNLRRNSSEIQDHIMAERKRRQVLSERFIALSATIPGLKKTDKAYILQEAINYVKQLQERVNELENHNKRKRDSVIFIKKSQACIIDKEKSTSSCEENSDNDDDHRYYSKKELPRVEARVIDKEILIGIHCEKQKDIVIRLMALLQNLHLSLASSSVLPFGTSTLKVTIIAQMDDEYCMSVNDLVNGLRQNLMESRDNNDNIS